MVRFVMKNASWRSDERIFMDHGSGDAVKRLLTTAPGSATPTLAVVYNLDSGQSEAVLITHIAPTPEIENVRNDYRRTSPHPGQDTTEYQGYGSCDPLP